MSHPLPPLRWDIFCRVIDNFGDIGVCWRLANILQKDYQQTVRLWMDEPQALAALEPSLNLNLKQQTLRQIEVCVWLDDFPTTWPLCPYADLPNIVIEAFGCELPSHYIQAMRDAPKQPIWINLEYFSAEPWVQGFHGLPSKQANGLDKTFFFPSVLPDTGGLMREADLIQRRDAFNDPTTSHHHTGINAWCKQWGLTEPLKNSFKISLFAYENKALDNLLNILSNNTNAEQPIEVYLPQGRLLTSAQAYFDRPLHAGDKLTQGNMTLHILPFLPQNEYDKLLWLCDLNFVRGEESFVRAQWAAKPFIWHIYPTDDDAHWDKLNAFLAAYTENLAPVAKTALMAFMHGWNQQTLDQQHWQNLITHWDALQLHAHQWVNQLENLGELTSNLVKTIGKIIESKV